VLGILVGFEGGDGVGFMVGLATGTSTDVGGAVTSKVGVGTAVDDVKGKQNDKNVQKRSNYSDDK
jgi:hypothetical protein